MVDPEIAFPAWSSMTTTQTQRWDAVLHCLAELVPAGATVVVDGTHAGVVADRLAGTLRANGHPCERLPGSPDGAGGEVPCWPDGPATIAVADGGEYRTHPPAGGWDVILWLRTGARTPLPEGTTAADVVLDLHDPAWPVIRRVDERLASSDRWYLTESRAFFAAKAASWDTRFGDDLPAYAAAVRDGGYRTGGVLVDVGCGTGRALPALRSAAGPTGKVIGLDLTPEMLAEARVRSAEEHASLLLADACRLPLANASTDGVFAAGLLMHLPDADAGLREIARITRTGGRLVLFHPSGRAALAGRHGRVLRSDEPLSEGPLTASTVAAGWRLDRYDDADHRFLAIATRV
ncbi:class I SAM-dependent methyltransferase [Cryptosporangium sp. NPDC051539]|uniref:class I SAM-dependent methyltransferase n=1 Tax=Cryptosporangium sp. NPDC051539 TaxID=3363962 RepID=UPI0037B3160F